MPRDNSSKEALLSLPFVEERALVSAVHITHLALRVHSNELAVGKSARTNVELIDRVSKVASLVSALKALDDTVANLGASLVCALGFLLCHLDLDVISSKVVLSRFARVNELAELALRVVKGSLSVANKEALLSVLALENVQLVHRVSIPTALAMSAGIATRDTVAHLCLVVLHFLRDLNN